MNMCWWGGLNTDYFVFCREHAVDLPLHTVTESDIVCLLYCYCACFSLLSVGTCFVFYVFQSVCFAEHSGTEQETAEWEVAL